MEALSVSVVGLFSGVRIRSHEHHSSSAKTTPGKGSSMNDVTVIRGQGLKDFVTTVQSPQ
jgi:hypothetical protein